MRTSLASRTLFLAALLMPAAADAQLVEISGGLMPLTGGGESAIALPLDIGVGYDRAFFGDRLTVGAVMTPTEWRAGDTGETWRTYRWHGYALARARGGELFVEGGPGLNCWSGFRRSLFGDGPVCRLAAVVGGGVRVGHFEIGARVMGWREAFKALRERPTGCDGRCDIHLGLAGGLRLAFVTAH